MKVPDDASTNDASTHGASMHGATDDATGVAGCGERWPALAQVRAASAGMRAQVPHLSGEEASDLLRLVTAATADFEALRLALVGRIEESGVWQQDPNATVNSWLRAGQTLDHRSAQADLRSARALRNYPALRRAAEAGDLSRAHVDAIVSIGEANDIRRKQLAEFMHIFVDVGRQQPVSVLKTVMRAWADQIDPVGVARDEHEAHQRRFLHVNLLADGVHVEGFFAKAEGAKVIAALNAALTKSRREVLGLEVSGGKGSRGEAGRGEAGRGEAGRGEAGRGEAGRGDRWRGHKSTARPNVDDAAERDLPVLSTAQQRADAFIAGIIDPMLENGGLPSSGGSRPAVTVLVPLERLERPCNPDHPDDMDWPGKPDDLDWPGKPDDLDWPGDRDAGTGATEGALPFVDLSASIGVTNGPGTALISAQTAQRLTCDCDIHRILINPDGLPLDVGRSMRTIPAHIRKALVVRDGGCVFPHCGRPPGWAEAHHIIHWAQGGRTSLDNAVLLCSKHHHKVHAEGHEVTIGPDGRGRVLVKSTRLRR